MRHEFITYGGYRALKAQTEKDQWKRGDEVMVSLTFAAGMRGVVLNTVSEHNSSYQNPSGYRYQVLTRDGRKKREYDANDVFRLIEGNAYTQEQQAKFADEIEKKTKQKIMSVSSNYVETSWKHAIPYPHRPFIGVFESSNNGYILVTKDENIARNRVQTIGSPTI